MTDLDTFPDRGPTRFVRARALGDIVSASLRFLTEHARPLAVGQLTIAGPALVLFVAVQALTGTAEVFTPDNPFVTDPDAFLDQYGATLLVPYLAFIVFSVVSYGVAFGYVSAYRQGHADGRVDWGDVSPTLWPMVSVSLVVLLVGVSGAFGLALFFAAGSALGPLAIATLALAALALFVYVLPFLWVAYPARLFDTDRSGEALVRGVALVRGRWWMAFGTVLVIGLIGMVLSVVAAVPAAVVLAVQEASGAPPTAWTRALMAGFNHLGSLLIATLFGVGSAFLHGSLAAGTDDVEMLDGISRLEADLDDAPDTPDAEADARWAPPGAERTRPAPEPPPAEPPPADPPSASPTDDGGYRGGGFRGGGFGT